MIGHTVSLPAASFDHYLSVLHEVGGSRSDNEDIIEEEDEDEMEEAMPPSVFRVSHNCFSAASVQRSEITSFYLEAGCIPV